MGRTTAFGLALGFGLVSSTAHAHIPIVNSGTTGVRLDNAVFIDDPEVSHVVYHEVTPAAPQLWITFDLEAGQEAFVQLGIPVLDRLADFRPAFALLGPGLSEVDLPFEIPEG